MPPNLVRIVQGTQPDEVCTLAAQSHGAVWRGSGVDEKGYDLATSGRCLVELGYFRLMEADLVIENPTKTHTKLCWKHEWSARDFAREMVNADLKVMQTATVIEDA